MTKANFYDFIVIGAGHNGLIAAALLAKARNKVLVVEQREVLGGSAATEEIWPGFFVNTGSDEAFLFRPEIVGMLDLSKLRLEFIDNPISAISLVADEPPLVLTPDIPECQEAIARISSPDAERFPQFIRMLALSGEILSEVGFLTPPNLAGSFLEMLPLLKSAIRFNRQRRRDVLEFLRAMPMSIHGFLSEWFENERLMGLLGGPALTGTMQGPMAPGTALMLMHHHTPIMPGRFQISRLVKGGMGKLSDAIAEAAQMHGAEIHLRRGVSKIITEEGTATGVVMSDGEEIHAGRIISNADPYRTLIGLAGPQNLAPQFVRKVRNIRFRGITAKLILALDELPQCPALSSDPNLMGGHMIVCPDLEYLERAFDDAKYGEVSKGPYLDILIPSVLDPSLTPDGKHLMSITIQYAPYKLRNRDWHGERKSVMTRTLEILSRFMPNLKDMIINDHLITPLDMEREYGLTGGCIYHGQMGMDQMLFMRPVPGYGRYRTPIKNLYLCGAGTHPGGGVTGAPGFNAAREVLKDQQL